MNQCKKAEVELLDMDLKLNFKFLKVALTPPFFDIPDCVRCLIEK